MSDKNVSLIEFEALWAEEEIPLGEQKTIKMSCHLPATSPSDAHIILCAHSVEGGAISMWPAWIIEGDASLGTVVANIWVTVESARRRKISFQVSLYANSEWVGNATCEFKAQQPDLTEKKLACQDISILPGDGSTVSQKFSVKNHKAGGANRYYLPLPEYPVDNLERQNLLGQITPTLSGKYGLTESSVFPVRLPDIGSVFILQVHELDDHRIKELLQDIYNALINSGQCQAQPVWFKEF